MNILDTFKGLFRPDKTAKQKPRRAIRRSGQGMGFVHSLAGGSSYYEALRNNGDRTSLTLQHRTPRRGLTSGERVELSMIARSLYDNGGMAAYAVNQIALYCAPLQPQASSGDPEYDNVLEAYFADWCKNADFYGRPEVDFGVLQEIACQGIDLDGDTLAVMTSEAGFPQVQMIEGYRVGSYSDEDDDVVDGVKIDAKGRVVGYVVGNDEDSQLVKVSECILLRDPSAAAPYRGIPPFRRGANDYRDAKDILGFEKVAVKHNSGLLGVIEGGEIEEPHGFTVKSLPEEAELEAAEAADPSSVSEKGVSRQDMLGGDIPILPEGKKYVQATSNRPNAQFGEFLDSLMAQFAAGLDLPPAFFLDTRLTGPNTRSVLGKAQRKFTQRQNTIARFVQWAWVRVIAHGISTGALQAKPGWEKIIVQRPARLTIDAGREATQDRDDTKAGLLTRQEHFGARGKDWQRENSQAMKEDEWILKECTRIARDTNTDVNILLSRYGFDTKQPQPKNETSNA